MLVICPTPIGNLDDVTPRQREALTSADIIACEDTRRAGKLLELLGIARSDGRPKLWRYDDHTARDRADEIADAVENGNTVVLTSDAGTPTISDPGYRLVRACRQRDLEVTALPGPAAAVVALSGSGLATDRFYFEGFLPTSPERRRHRLEELDRLHTTIVTYESPRRIIKALDDVIEVCGPAREVCIGRELTKLHEEFVVGSAERVRQKLEEQAPVRGEIVLCIAGRPDTDKDDGWEQADRAIVLLHDQGVRRRTIKDFVDEMFDIPRSQIYDRIDQLVD